MTVDVSVIIPSTGRINQLRDCIEGVLSQDSVHAIEIIVVIDGADSEETAKALESEFCTRHQLRFDTSSERRGSAAAKNIGAGMAQGWLLVFLDDDTIPSSSWLESLVESYSADIVGVGGSERKRNPPSLFSRFIYSLYGGRTGRIAKSGLVISNFTPDKEGSEYVDCLQGCNMSFRRTEFLQSGGFDERFIGTAYREETDFCMRIKSYGKLLFIPRAMVDHIEKPHGGNSPSSFRDWNYWYHRNNTYFFLKNFEPVSWTLWVRHWILELLLAIFRMLTNRDTSPVATLKAGILDGRKMAAESRG